MTQKPSRWFSFNLNPFGLLVSGVVVRFGWELGGYLIAKLF